jgi:hypothetical protein
MSTTTQQSEVPMTKKKRGRPRKYDPSIPRATIVRQFYNRNKVAILKQHKKQYAELALMRYQTYKDYLETLDKTAPFNMYRSVAEEIERVQRRIDKVNNVLESVADPIESTDQQMLLAVE